MFNRKLINIIEITLHCNPDNIQSMAVVMKIFFTWLAQSSDKVFIQSSQTDAHPYP